MNLSVGRRAENDVFVLRMDSSEKAYGEQGYFS